MIDLFIENTARVNFGNDYHFLQQKGLDNGTYKLNGEDITDIEIISLEFKSKWVQRLVMNENFFVIFKMNEFLNHFH